MKEVNENSDRKGLCQHSTIELKDIADELRITPMSIVGNPQIGKSTLAKHLVKALVELSKEKNLDIRVRVWDSSTKLLFNAPVDRVYVIPEPQLTVYGDLNNGAMESIEYSSGLEEHELERILEEKCIAFDTQG